MELLQLRYFRDAAELENFSKVAEKNMVPQPSISKTISKLENELGVQLFDRVGKKISLNKDGQYFYNKVNLALRNIDDAIKHFNQPAYSNIHIYIQAGNRFTSMLTADFLTSSHDIFLTSVNQISIKDFSSYDFTFMQLLSDMDDYYYKELMEDEIVLIVAKDHPLAVHDELSIKDLADYPYIAHYRSMNLRDFTDEYCRNVGGFTPGVVFETSDSQAIRYMVAKQKGIALMPANHFNAKSSVKFKTIRLKEKVYRTLVIAWHKNKTLSTHEQQFLDFTVDWFKNI